MGVTIKREPGEGAKYLEQTLKALSGMGVEVGWTKAARYPRTEIEAAIAKEGTKRGKTYKHPKKSSPGPLVAEVAYKHEFGEGRIPPRPMIRPTIRKRQKQWSQTFNRGVKEALNGKLNPNFILGRTGLQIQGDIGTTINQLRSPQLSKVTVQRRLAKYRNKRKKGDVTKPLIDTGFMLSSLSHEVVKIK